VKILFEMTREEAAALKTMAVNAMFESPSDFVKQTMLSFFDKTAILVEGVAIHVNETSEESDDAKFVADMLRDADQLSENFDKLRAIAQPSMDCPECGGSGTVASGSLGSMCVGCDGSGVVDQPFSTPLDLPNVAALRGQFVGLMKQLDAGEEVERNYLLALRGQLDDMVAVGKEAAQKALAAPQQPSKRLAAPGRRTRRLQASPKHLGGVSDAELDALEGETSDDEPTDGGAA
jgi:hypothetical protein